MKIATWNVNSINVRLPQVIDWIKQHQPDILALQEIKIINEKFPLADFTALGYEVCINGQPTYNGVATISKLQPDEIQTDIPEFIDPQRRVLATTYGKIRVINLYVPNGESVVSEKYIYKLDWLTKVTQYLNEQLKKYDHVVVLGDFNIAPADIDVHDPKLWQDKVLFSDKEKAAFEKIINLGFKDCFRFLYPDQQQYTWWDYRAAAFRRNNGLRIDHILIDEMLAKKCNECVIDKTPRKNERPSDHAPVIVTFTKQ